MSGPWTTLIGEGDASPYIHWWDAFERLRFPTGSVDLTDAHFSAGVRGCVDPDGHRAAICKEDKGFELAQDRRGAVDVSAPRVPLPANAINAGFGDFVKAGKDWVGAIKLGQKKGQYRADDLPPRDAVVIGIIDAAIALGHQRFQFKDGSTRFLSAWQQAAPAGGCADVPFGQELSKPEIDQLIADHSKGGTLDEDAFNAAANLVDLINPMGQREANHLVAHGTHVLDLAAGFDPLDAKVTDKMLRRRPIVAVNLPNRHAIGSNGIFLETFVIQAIARIVDVSDKLWSLQKGLSGKDKARGYPIVINLSYGLHAGPKDGSMALERYITDLVARRTAEGKAPVRVVLPAGNENLDQGHARVTLRAEQPSHQFDWRILPEDQTANYLEIWSDVVKGNAPLPLSIKVTAPDGTTTQNTVGEAALSYLDVGPFARIYCQSRIGKGQNGTLSARQRYLICIAPTLAYEAGAAQAPSGLWQVEVTLAKGSYREGLEVFAYVQSDQSTRPAGDNGQMSYLEDARYDIVDADGAEVDTYRFTRDKLTPAAADQEPYAQKGPMQRKGTLNAIASLWDAVVVAGHRVSDGKPASYSATGGGARFAGARGEPTLSYPTDEGPAHRGLLAAGGRSSMTVVMQGTSFATALATRDISDLLQGWQPGDPEVGTHDAMQARARVEDPNDSLRGRIFPLKSGAGRMPGTPVQRQPRRGQN